MTSTRTGPQTVLRSAGIRPEVNSEYCTPSLMTLNAASTMLRTG